MEFGEVLVSYSQPSGCKGGTKGQVKGHVLSDTGFPYSHVFKLARANRFATGKRKECFELNISFKIPCSSFALVFQISGPLALVQKLKPSSSCTADTAAFQ